MSAIEHCDLNQLAAKLSGKVDHFLLSASYEERAYGIWQHLRNVINGKRFVCFNKNHASYLQKSINRIQNDDPEATVVELDSDSPLTTFDALQKTFDILRKNGPCRVAVDLTGFTRESLAILLYIARNKLPPGSVIIAMYHSASSYGRMPASGWLSQGVREVRSVLGYAGLVRLSAETHLVLLAGYEIERAQEIIEAVQPNRITLGRVTSENSISSAFNDTLNAFINRLEAFYAGMTFERCDFSSADPFLTRDNLLRATRSSLGNVVVACLNTKLATVGVCLAAIEQPTIQLIYAQPVCYNVADYSKPSGKALFFEIAI